jgi:predicted esterase
LDLLLKENELIEGAIPIKPMLNIAITESVRTEDNTKVLIIGGNRQAQFKQLEETDIADILEVNGYAVTSMELEEGEDLTNRGVTDSRKWCHKNFFN